MRFRGVMIATCLVIVLFFDSCKAFDYSNIASRVFEVVVKVNSNDNFNYDHEVPDNELTYYEKNRKYDSIGTAFAIDGDKFVSAAHVFDVLSPTQMEGFFLRDTKGQVYEIASVLAFDYGKDYIVFTVPELKVQGLAIATDYAINSKVYSVGNALGEGIVFRDGMLTSETVDGEEGKWNWLRFSAPASPGNSGGPLINEWGQVLGIIEMKSESENLNYALPLKEVVYNKLATFDFNYEYSFPTFQDTRYKKFTFKTGLPLTLNELSTKSQEPYRQFVISLGEELRNAQDLDRFPMQEGARALFGKSFDVEIIAGIEQKADYTWQYKDSTFESQSSLKSGGRVSFGTLWNYTTFAVKLDVPVEPLDSKNFMDNLLQTYYITRPIGSSSVRVTSMGKASDEEILTDKFARQWNFLQYNDPRIDEATLVLYFHVPNGFVGVISNIRYGDLSMYKENFRIMVDYLYFNYKGTLAQWKSYLANPIIKKTNELMSLKCDLNVKTLQHYLEWEDLEKYLRVDMKLAGFGDVNDEGIDIAVDTAIYGHTENWNIMAIRIDPSGIGDTSFEISKMLEPGTFSDKRQRELWDRLHAQKTPYDNRVINSHDAKLIQSVVIPTSQTEDPIAYVLRTNMSQETDDKVIKQVHSQITKDFRQRQR